MSSDLIETVINQVIGAIIGAGVSFIVSWYFYIKSDIPSRVLRQMLDELTLLILQGKFGSDVCFTFEGVPANTLPQDRDQPHIVRLWFSNKMPKPGETIIILLRTRDEGLNFGGLIKTFESSNLQFSTRNEAYGFFSTKANLPEDVALGTHTITFQLTDSQGKTHTQSFNFEVIE